MKPLRACLNIFFAQNKNLISHTSLSKWRVLEIPNCQTHQYIYHLSCSPRAFALASAFALVGSKLAVIPQVVAHEWTKQVCYIVFPCTILWSVFRTTCETAKHNYRKLPICRSFAYEKWRFSTAKFNYQRVSLNSLGRKKPTSPSVWARPQKSRFWRLVISSLTLFLTNHWHDQLVNEYQ